MPDLRDKRKAKMRQQRHAKKWPGDNNQLPNPAPTDSERLPGDLARDINNEGIASDPLNKPIP